MKEWVRAYWNRRAADFDRGESCVSRTPALRAAWARVYHPLLGSGRRRILDLGVGTGEVALLFADLGHEVWGVDLAPAMVRRARAKAPGRLRLLEADAEALPFRDAAFDVLHARHLLWTLPRPERALREWRRVLRPGGRLLLLESVWPPHRRPDYPPPECFPFFGGLRLPALAAFLRRGGLQVRGARDLRWLRQRGRAAALDPKTPPKIAYHLVWGVRPPESGKEDGR